MVCPQGGPRCKLPLRRRPPAAAAAQPRVWRVLCRRASKGGLGKIFTEASITARPFFERRGLRAVRERIVMVWGVSMTNFAMEKDLLPG